MARSVWRRLPPEDLAAFRAFLDELPAAGGPRYGLLGIKVSWWSRLSGPTRPYVVLVAGGRIALSKRTFHRRREVTRHDFPLGDLKAMRVHRGPLLESARLTFADGYSLRVGGLPRWQSRPLERYLAGEADALDPGTLSPEQLTNFCQALEAVGLRPLASGGGSSPAA
ncbi:MAG: hypothetical protein JW785_00410 [Acidimicrobiia bacterium]|nr:hypothetical protein [Acidimicrobiia bacterium]